MGGAVVGRPSHVPAGRGSNAMRVTDIREGDRVSGLAIKCTGCGGLFIGRGDALFCSDACRQAAYRERVKVGADNSFMGKLAGFNDD